MSAGAPVIWETRAHGRDRGCGGKSAVRMPGYRWQGPCHSANPSKARRRGNATQSAPRYFRCRYFYPSGHTTRVKRVRIKTTWVIGRDLRSLERTGTTIKWRHGPVDDRLGGQNVRRSNRDHGVTSRTVIVSAIAAVCHLGPKPGAGTGGAARAVVEACAHSLTLQRVATINGVRASRPFLLFMPQNPNPVRLHL
jgi:hypothetical protein